MARLGAVFLLVVSCVAPGPRLVFTDQVPEDVQELATQTWERFLDVFPARANCIGELTLDVDGGLPDRAIYHPGDATVVLRIPWTAPRLSHALIHEMAHHLEFACRDHERFRRVFLGAIGRDGSWFAASSWEETPSEIFAETVSVLVMGDEARPAMRIDPAALELVRAWGRGEMLRHAASAP